MIYIHQTIPTHKWMGRLEMDQTHGVNIKIACKWIQYSEYSPKYCIYLVSMGFFWMIPSSWKTVLFRPKTIWDSADPAGIAPKSEGLLWSPDTNPSVCGFPGRNPETRQAGNLTINGWVLGENLQETMIFTPKLFGVSCRFSLHPESIDWDKKAHWCTKKQSEHA